jgi:hypothetical protein
MDTDNIKKTIEDIKVEVLNDSNLSEQEKTAVLNVVKKAEDNPTDESLQDLSLILNQLSSNADILANLNDHIADTLELETEASAIVAQKAKNESIKATNYIDEEVKKIEQLMDNPNSNNQASNPSGDL